MTLTKEQAQRILLDWIQDSHQIDVILTLPTLASAYKALCAIAETTPEALTARTDTQRLDCIETLVAQGACPGIINDDKGHWAVVESGMQTIQQGPGPDDVQTTFFVDAGQWRNSLREAIDAYLDEVDTPDERD